MKKQTKQSGSYFLELLPAEIQQKVIDNIIMLESSELSNDILDLREGEYLNLADLLARCFEWDSSSEGREYWEGVINKGYDGKNLEQSVVEIYGEKTEQIKELISNKLDKIFKEMFVDDEDSSPSVTALRNDTGKAGSYYLTFMTEQEQQQYTDNVNKFCPKDFIEHLLAKKYLSFRDFVGSSFPFMTSAEGQAYWTEIAGRKVDEDIAENLEELLYNLNISTENGKV
jgi:hypothetical protein